MQNPKILIATGNKGKFAEISSLLNEVNIGSVGAFEYDLEEPEENGADFEENSLIKAKYYSQKTNLISLADDSGLCIDLLDGEPGIYSARWAIDGKTGEKDFNLAFAKIAKELEKKNIDISKDEVKAHFICNLTIFDPKTGKHHSFEGRVDGNLTFPPKGENGFGYDPIFVAGLFDKTFAQIENTQKDKISHRSKAFSQFKDFLNSEKSTEFLQN